MKKVVISLGVAIVFLAGCSPVTDIKNTPLVSPLPGSSSDFVGSADDAWNQITLLLKDNGACNLPCFWSLTPGETRRSEAEKLLRPLAEYSRHYGFDENGGDLLWIQEFGNLQIYIDAAYYLKAHDVVEQISFDAMAIEFFGMDDERNHTQYDDPIFNETLRTYMLPQILTDYGPPDEVYVLTYAGSTVPNLAQPSFYLYLLYPEQGIFIKYTAPWGREGEYVVGCPATAHMELWLLPPGTEDYAGKLRGDWESLFGAERIYYKTIEETAGMTPEQFYQTFKGGDRAVCLRTPAELWTEIEQ